MQRRAGYAAFTIGMISGLALTAGCESAAVEGEGASPDDGSRRGELIIYQDTANAGADHHGGAMFWGNDGKFYFTTGDEVNGTLLLNQSRTCSVFASSPTTALAYWPEPAPVATYTISFSPIAGPPAIGASPLSQLLACAEAESFDTSSAQTPLRAPLQAPLVAA